MLPIFIHHETDQKPQTGGGAGQRYVKTCVTQAGKYNPEVILFGDKATKAYSRSWIDVSEFTSEKWEEFLSVFENYSTYPLSWALGIFKRFFIFEEYMKKNRIEKCVILDSDVLVWCSFDNIEFLQEADVALEICEDQRLSSLPFENDYRWGACAGVAVMTLDALCDFTAFTVETYKTNKKLLLEKWDVHRRYHLPGGICEMSLLYLWMKKRSDQYKTVNFGLMRENVLPCVVAGNRGNGYGKTDVFKTEKTGVLRECVSVYFKDKIPYVYGKRNNIPIRVLSIHFGGKTKIFMDNFSRGKTYGGTAMIEWHYWIWRNRLSRIKNKLKNLHR